MFRGNQDLVVCEGFVGNVTLKLAESVTGSIMRVIKHEVSQGGIVKKLGGAVMKSMLTDLKNRFAYEQYGGAMLIGVNGICTILHGASGPLAFRNGLSTITKYCSEGIMGEINAHASLLKKEPAC
jgi:glycerol-3-phosphate acyltransferase PlsX